MDLPFAADDIRELVGALCHEEGHDPALWHPEDAEGRGGGRNGAVARIANQEAKHICGLCPVRNACLAQALENNEQHGIWGGLDPDERAALKTGGAA